MDPLTRIADEIPVLRRPVLVAAFEGWNDAGEAASGTVDALAELTGATVVYEIEAEEFFDFQVNRPVIRWDGGERTLDWPSTTISVATMAGEDATDLVIVRGQEPNLRWRTFTDTLIDVARKLGVERIVTLGALQVDVPHTREVPMTGSASDDDIAARFGLRRSSYEGPTGIVGVLHAAAASAGFDAVTLWVGVPHYLAGTAYVAATLALARRTAALMDADLDLSGLEDDATNQLSDIGDLVSEDDELADYVSDLEERADADPDPVLTEELPRPPVSGEELAAEFERYLRDRSD